MADHYITALTNYRSGNHTLIACVCGWLGRTSGLGEESAWREHAEQDKSVVGLVQDVAEALLLLYGLDRKAPEKFVENEDGTKHSVAMTLTEARSYYLDDARKIVEALEEGGHL